MLLNAIRAIIALAIAVFAMVIITTLFGDINAALSVALTRGAQ